MKKLLLLVLAGLPIYSIAGELDSIKLITPVDYDRNSSFSQTVKSKTQSFLAGALSIDIEKKVAAKIKPFHGDLTGYYSKPGELDAFVKTVVQEGIKKHLTAVTDDNMIGFYGYLGTNLIGKFADKILEKEGVTDPARRALWVTKMTDPFNGCVSKSLNAMYDASHCIDALAASLVPSAGIGLVYELSRASLSSSLPASEKTPFNAEQANLYKVCIAKTKSSATDVKNCALATMKMGVLKVTDQSLSKTINDKASSKAKAAEIKKLAWPAFSTCVNSVGNNAASKVSYTDQFFGCIDSLVQNTGTLLVSDKVSSTPAIIEAFGATEAKKLSVEKSAQFKKCTEEQKAKGARAEGMLDISPCENTITNEVTYKVVAHTLKMTAQSSLKTDKSLSVKTGNEGVQMLDKCWNNRQSSISRESCLRSTIVDFSQKVATIKLNDAIPADVPGKSELNKASVAELAKCIDAGLPDNISESNNLSKRLDKCTGKLTRNVALKVANHQIRATAEGNISAADTNAMIKNLVEDEFAKCIGETPSDETLEKCSNSLTVKAAKQIAETSFTKEVNAYLDKSGGLKALGVTQAQVDSFLKELTTSNRACIEKKATGPVMDQVNTCIKGSVKKIAFFFGDIQFNKSVGNMYAGKDKDKKIVEDQFKKSLDECLNTKNGKEFSITDYTKNLYTCSDKVSSSTTLVVGRDQINSSLDTYLKDRPGMNMKVKRDEIRGRLLGNFQTCLDKNENQSTCIDALKKDATKTIVVNYGQSEVKAQLSTDKLPSEVSPVEDQFIACTESKLEGEILAAHLDECTKDFALGFAKQLGTLKLNYLLKGALGSEGFNASKKNIDDALLKYTQCLDGLKVYSINDGLTSKLSICTDGLTANGMSLVRSNINQWMSTEEKDAATLMIKEEFATFLPCLSALLPASPYSPALQENIESSVKPLAVLLSHYIEYNPENAKQTLDGIIKKLSVDINDVAATTKAKHELLDFLYSSGALDQFLKAIIRGTVKDALTGISDKDVPQDLRAILLKKENFEEIFNSPEGSKIVGLVMDKILKPALINGEDLQGDAYKNNMASIKDTVVKLLIDAPSFGEQAIKMSIQKQINDMSGVTRFFAKVIYGGDSLQWEKVRLTKKGKEAEEYIKNYLLTPKFKGVPQTQAEQKKINDEAQKLVTEAVKSHG